jgi:aminodeoxychorismate synthase component I
MPVSDLHLLPEFEDQCPAEIAAHLRNLEGFAFFDTAREGDGRAAISLITALPQRRLQGSIHREKDVEALRQAHRELQRAHSGADRGFPCALLAGTVDYDGVFDFAEYPDALVFAHRDQRWHGNPNGKLALQLANKNSALQADGPDAQPKSRTAAASAFEGRTSREEFCQWVQRAQDYIRAGDIYQVNLSHRLEISSFGGDPWPLYESLRHHSPAPYAAFLRQSSRTILSSSPELFLKISGHTIQTRPIKGTRPRRSDPLADERSAFDLLTSSKEISELVMITDLERNDLGQVCEWGSVSVRELLKLERHEQVFHLVSTVEGRLRSEVDPVQALRACFPGGSITGAPKKRAREIIAEIEPQPRGLYTGAIGWFGADGESQFSIAIRTLVHEPPVLHFHVGAGIVADSMPELEWQETLDKAAGILLATDRMTLDADGRHPGFLESPVQNR